MPSPKPIETVFIRGAGWSSIKPETWMALRAAGGKSNWGTAFSLTPGSMAYGAKHCFTTRSGLGSDSQYDAGD